MADITQIFNLLSKADTSGIDKATRSVAQHGNAIEKTGKQAAGASGRLSRLGGWIRSIGSSALGAVRGGLSRLFGALKGLATLAGGALLGGLAAIGRGIAGLPDLFDGAGSAAKKVGAGAGKAFDKLKKSVDSLRQSSKEMFGALGKVGVGFVQAAKKTAKAPIALFKGVVKGAASAGKALAGVAAIAAVAGAALAGSFFGAIAEASPRASAALQRMGTAFGEAKTAFFTALGETLAPLLERVATLMEDPRFLEFATTLGTAVGNAIIWVADLIENKIVPGWEKIIEAAGPLIAVIRDKLGGAFEFIKTVVPETVDKVKEGWTKIKASSTTAAKVTGKKVKTGWKKIFASVGALLVAFKARLKVTWDSIKSAAVTAFESLKSKIGEIWDGIKSKIMGVLSAISGAVSGAISGISFVMSTLESALKGPWIALQNFVEGVWESIKDAVSTGINKVIGIINGLIRGYNDIAGKIPGAPKLPTIPPVSLAKGGIVNSPINAIVGDNPRSPEVVAPLDELVDLIRRALGQGAGMPPVTINVTVAPGGFATPEEAGRRVGNAYIDEMRARGIKI